MPPEVAAAPAVQTTVTTVEAVAEAALALTITTPEDYQRAAEMAQKIAGGIAKLDKERTSLTKPLNDAKQRLIDWFKVPTGKLEAAQKTLRDRMVAFTTEQKRIADEARKKAEQEERDRQAELKRQADEQARIAREAQEQAEREAEQRRQAEAEYQRQTEEARKAGDSDAAAAAEESARQQRMARLREENQRQQEADDAAERARALEAQAAPRAVNVPTVAPTTAKGISQRQVAKYEVVDRNLIPDGYWLLDEKSIGAVVRAQGVRAMDTIPGIKVWMEDDISIRGKS